MLWMILIVGGLLIMMGQHDRSEALFYYFRLEDQVPENHLLRLIDRHVNFEFIRAKLKDAYSDAGRPSIDPELLLRLLLVGLSLRGHERKKTGGRATYASGVALVHRTGLRSGDSSSLHVF
jgi:transposase